MGSFGGKLYSTHIGETDIAMGDTSRLTRAVEWVSKNQGIKTIFLLPSSVPEVIGTDLKALAQELSPQFPDTCLIPLTAGGFDVCGHKGVEYTLLELCKTLPREVHQTKQPSFNIIGSCADMFRFHADAAEIARLEKENALEQIAPMQTVLARFLRVHREENKLVLAGYADVVPGIAEYGKECFRFSRTECYCDCPEMTGEDMDYLDDSAKERVAYDSKGFLMGSGELFRMAKRDQSLQIAVPDHIWRHAYEPPLAGFRGSVNLAAVWINEMARMH